MHSANLNSQKNDASLREIISTLCLHRTYYTYTDIIIINVIIAILMH